MAKSGAERQRAYNAAHRDAINARARAWYATPEGGATIKARSRRYDLVHPGARAAHQAAVRKAHPETGRARERMRLYRLSQPAYAQLLALQGGLCANKNCGEVPTQVDHDHSCCPGGRSCGKCVRGLLCRACNFSAGASKDDPRILRGLADYLAAGLTTAVEVL